MPLKLSINIVIYLSLGTLLILVGGLIAIVCNKGVDGLLMLEMFLLLPFFLVFFFKIQLINGLIKLSKYPEVFISVLHQIKSTNEMDINWSEEDEENLQNPRYSTKEFIESNRLTNIYFESPRKPSLFYLIILSTIYCYSMIVKKIEITENIFFIIFSGFIILFFLLDIVRYQKELKKEKKAILIFDTIKLQNNGQNISWEKIIDWDYLVKNNGKKMIKCIAVNYFDNEKNINISDIDLTLINTSKIEILIMLTHFKNKYGKSNL